MASLEGERSQMDQNGNLCRRYKPNDERSADSVWGIGSMDSVESGLRGAKSYLKKRTQFVKIGLFRTENAYFGKNLAGFCKFWA